MEKLKNLVNPGSKKDDDVMYGSGPSDDSIQPGHSKIGSTNTGLDQDNHLSSSHTAGHDSLATSSNPAGVSQQERDATTGRSQYNTATTGGASHGLREPYASRMPGGFDDDDAATTASVSSGIPGQSQSQSANSAVNEPIYHEKPLPRETTSGPGIGAEQSSLTGNSYPDRSVENRSRYGDQSGSSHLNRDVALETGAARTNAYHHADLRRGNNVSETERFFPLGGSSTSDGHGSKSAVTHSSNFTNKADPRVDSDGSRTTGNTSYSSTSPNYRSGTGATPSSGDQGLLGNKTGAGTEAGAVGSGMTRSIGHGPESWQHEHGHQGHQFKGDPCESGAVSGLGGPHFVPGPHSTDTANRLDPHVDSGLEGATGGPIGHHHHGRHVHQSEEAAFAGGAGAAGLGALEADHRQQGTTKNTAPSRLNPSDAGSHENNIIESDAYDADHHTVTGVPSRAKTAGSHQSDMLNKLDPRVDSDMSKQQGFYDNDHHYGRDAALAGAGGTGLYEAEKNHHRHDPNLQTLNSTSGNSGRGRGPYGSGVEVADTSRHGITRDQSAISSAGSGHQSAAASGHHYGRDAGLVGAGGVAAYEAEKRFLPSHRSDLAATPQDRLAGSGHQPATDSKSSPLPSSSYSSGGQPQIGAQTERDPIAAGGVKAGATGEGDRQELKDYERTDNSTQVRDSQNPGAPIGTYASPDRSNNSGKGHPFSHHASRDTALVEGPGAGATAFAGHGHPQRDAAGLDNGPYYKDLSGHHAGRDVAGGGLTESGAGHYRGTRHGNQLGKDTTTVEATGAGAGAPAGQEPSHRDIGGYGIDPYQNTSQGHHTGRDAALLGSAAGVGGLAEHEYSKKDAVQQQNEHSKEGKALEKQHLKEIKHHDKELANQEKAHEKALEKSERRHEKAMGKDERKHEKVVEKDETKQEHGGKKHGGLLGLFHREKPDQELKDEEAQRRAATNPGRKDEEMAAGKGARDYDPLQQEHGSQSGVHDSPIGIGSGHTTHDAYGAHDSGHNKLHKDPPSKVVESRGYEFQ